MHYLDRILQEHTKKYLTWKNFADKAFFVKFLRDSCRNYIVGRIRARNTSSKSFLRQINFSARTFEDFFQEHARLSPDMYFDSP